MLLTRYLSAAYFILSVCATGAFAQAKDSASDSTFLPLAIKAETRLVSAQVEVPLEEVSNHPFVTVMINGRGPFRLGIETGAPILILTEHTVRIVNRDTSVNPKGFIVDSITVGGATFLNVVAQQRPEMPVSLDGLLGLGVYYDLLTTFDYKHRRVRFSRDTLPSVNNRNIFPIIPIGKQVYGIEIAVNEKPDTAILDTQNEMTFVAVPSLTVPEDFLASPDTIGFVGGPDIGRQVLQKGRFKGAIHVGGVTFQQPIVAITAIPYEYLQYWNVGWAALRQSTVTLDQRSRRIQFVVANPTVPPPLPERGFVYLRVDSAAKVTMMFPTRLAAQQGIAVGDVIVSINGLPFNTSLWNAERKKDAAIRLVVQRGAEKKTVLFTRQVLVR